MDNENQERQPEKSNTSIDPAFADNTYFAEHEPEVFLDEDSAVNVTNSEMVNDQEL